MEQLELLKTGIPNLDQILGGGIPVYSVNIIAGHSGTGKTIFTQQLMFANATAEKKCLYFTTLSEPAFKLIRYQRQFRYFDVDKLNNAVLFIDIGSVIREHGLDEAIATITKHVEEHQPRIIAIDSFKAIHDLAETNSKVRQFGYDLAVNIAAWGCTSFFVGEYTEQEIQNEPIFAIADGIFYTSNNKQGMQNIRMLNITKLRGQNYFTGDHPFRISSDGITVFPRVKTPTSPPPYRIAERRISTGISGLDEMFSGGIPEGTATLVAGGAGVGKTLVGLHFIIQGIQQGEPGVLVTFQETPEQLFTIAKGFGWDLPALCKVVDGLCPVLKLLYTSPVELSVDEHAMLIKSAIQEIGAKRVVIDSLMDIEIATSDKVRYKDYIYSLVNFFKAEGITAVLTNEIPELFGSVQLTSYGISFISDNVILLRYVELESSITRAISILKARGSEHDKAVREFNITSDGITIMDKFEGQEGVLSGKPTRSGKSFAELLDKMK